MKNTRTDRATKQRGDAEMFAIAVVILCVTVFLAVLITELLNRASCNDYGKTRFMGQVYECKAS